MSYTAPHKLLTISGALFTGTLERWSFGMRFLENSGITPPTQAMVDATVTPLTTFWSSAVTIGQLHSLDTAKLAQIGTDGKYPPGHVPSIHTFSPALFPPGTNGTGLPGQVSMAVGFTTSQPRGRAHAGRIYLPPTSMMVGSDGRWTTTQAIGAANAVRTLVNALNGITGMGFLTVMSDLGTGTSWNVTGIRVGRVPDTIRRRRRQLVEGYQSVAL